MEVLDNTSANYLVEHDDGRIESVGKSKQNRLLLEHNLWGLLRDGDEILTTETEGGLTIRVIPDGENAADFSLVVEDMEPLFLGSHLKERLMNVLLDGKEKGDLAARLYDLFESLREGRVRVAIMTKLAGEQPFASHLEARGDGWFIHDHLLLTWEGEFRHPGTESATRSGSTVSPTANETAYEPDIARGTNDAHKKVTIDGRSIVLTEEEIWFVAKSIWAMQNTPRRI